MRQGPASGQWFNSVVPARCCGRGPCSVVLQAAPKTLSSVCRVSGPLAVFTSGAFFRQKAPASLVSSCSMTTVSTVPAADLRFETLRAQIGQRQVGAHLRGMVVKRPSSPSALARIMARPTSPLAPPMSSARSTPLVSSTAAMSRAAARDRLPMDSVKEDASSRWPTLVRWSIQSAAGGLGVRAARVSVAAGGAEAPSGSRGGSCPRPGCRVPGPVRRPWPPAGRSGRSPAAR